MAQPALRAVDASWHVGATAIVDRASISVDYGTVMALVGPNGAGKSTLVSLLTGDRRPSHGTVEMDGRPVRDIPLGERARRRAVLTQDNSVSFPFLVRDVAMMGRAPWWGRSESADDAMAVDQALAAMDVAHLAHRTFTSLSGGERARVSVARVLAQRTPIVILDEPTAALDVRHQEDIMALARQLAGEGTAVVVVVHDLSLAAAYADQVAVMSKGAVAHVGPPAQVLTPEILEPIYGIGMRVVTDPQSSSPLIVPVRRASGSSPDEP